jgi:DNA repair exonuclease SbcCD nuclease subunit
MPDNVHIFSDDAPTCFNFDHLNVSVWGAAFVRPLMENTPLVRIPRLNPDRINILCQHGDTRNLLSKTCPINVRDIAYRGFTYAALGHVHMPDEPSVIDNTTVAYSGCPIGRSFDETGWGGALMVTIGDDRSVSIENVRFAAKRYMVEKLDISGITDYTEAVTRIEALIRDKQYGKETSLRVILEGEIAPAVSLPITTLTRKCQEAVAYLELKDRTLPIFDTAYLENDMTLRGAFYRQLLPLLSQGSERERAVAAEALRAGLAAIDNRTVFSDIAPESDAEEVEK